MASDSSRARREGVPPPKPTLTLPLLATADTHLVPVQSQFLQLVSDHLGDHLTSADGFDDLVNTPISTIDAESGSVDTLAASVADAAFVPGAFSDSVLTPIGQDTATFLNGGDTILTGLGLAVGPITLDPTPAPVPTDPGQGGAPFEGDGLLLPDDGGVSFTILPNIGFG